MNQDYQNNGNQQSNPQTVPNQPMPNAQPTYNTQQGYTQNYQQSYTQPVQSTVYSTQPVQPTYQQPVQPQNVQTVNPMAAVTNLNKEEAMEEALSHTTQYSPFQAQVAEIKPQQEQANNKKAYIVIGVMVVIIALFIMFLPQISKLFGW